MAGQVLAKNSCEKFKHLYFLSWKLPTFRHFRQAENRYASPEPQISKYVSLIAALSPFFLQLVVFAKFGL